MRSLLRRLFPNAMRWQSTRRYFWGQFWRSGEWELRELKRYVDPAKGALDIGGNTGVYAYHLARTAKWVKVFEPNPSYAERLVALALPGVTIERAALSDRAGDAVLRVPHVGGRDDYGMASLEASAVADADVAQTIPVPLRTLDSYGLTGVGFIKLDVEGHEEAVLNGAQETIRANRPAILAEIEERHNAGGLARIAAQLAALGYTGYYFERGVRKPLSGFDAARDQVVDAALDSAAHNRRALAYINNFLFLPATVA